jgi:hypothetical protein
MSGSFVPETDRPVYGLTTDIQTHNPLRVATHEHAAIGRDLAAADHWRDRVGHVLRGPGWKPAHLRDAPHPAPAASPAQQDSPAPDPLGVGAGDAGTTCDVPGGGGVTV